MAKITRRNALARGGRAVAAAAVLSTLPSIAHAKEDAELFSCFEKCKRLETEYIAAINRHDEVWQPIWQQFHDHPASNMSLNEDLAEAEARAGLPALEKKRVAAERTWLDALDRFYDMPAYTPEGIILKFTVEWGEWGWRYWRAKDYPNLEFNKGAMASVLMDLERLSERAI